LNLNCIHTTTTRDCSGAYRLGPVLPCFTAGCTPLTRAPPTSASAGPLPATPCRLTAALAPRPSRAPHRRVVPPTMHPPPRSAAIKASATDRCPFFTPCYFLLGKAARSTPPRPLYLLSTLANQSVAASPRIITTATIFSPLPVSATLEALSAKWPCLSPSFLLPCALGPHRCRLRSPKHVFVVKTPSHQTASPPHHH
jgi:hypothetical protein